MDGCFQLFVRYSPRTGWSLRYHAALGARSTRKLFGSDARAYQSAYAGLMRQAGDDGQALWKGRRDPKNPKCSTRIRATRHTPHPSTSPGCVNPPTSITHRMPRILCARAAATGGGRVLVGRLHTRVHPTYYVAYRLTLSLEEINKLYPTSVPSAPSRSPPPSPATAARL